MASNSYFDLTGKKAVVTGGGKGLGLAITTALIKAGAEVNRNVGVGRVTNIKFQYYFFRYIIVGY